MGQESDRSRRELFADVGDKFATGQKLVQDLGRGKFSRRERERTVRSSSWRLIFPSSSCHAERPTNSPPGANNHASQDRGRSNKFPPAALPLTRTSYSTCSLAADGNRERIASPRGLHFPPAISIPRDKSAVSSIRAGAREKTSCFIATRVKGAYNTIHWRAMLPRDGKSGSFFTESMLFPTTRRGEIRAPAFFAGEINFSESSNRDLCDDDTGTVWCDRDSMLCEVNLERG